MDIRDRDSSNAPKWTFLRVIEPFFSLNEISLMERVLGHMNSESTQQIIEKWTKKIS